MGGGGYFQFSSLGDFITRKFFLKGISLNTIQIGKKDCLILNILKSNSLTTGKHPVPAVS